MKNAKNTTLTLDTLNLDAIDELDVTLFMEESSRGLPEFAASCCTECCGGCTGSCTGDTRDPGLFVPEDETEDACLI